MPKSKDLILHVEKKCANPICGETFKATRYWQRFCSKKCRMYAYFTREYAAEKLMEGETPDPFTPLPTQDELDEMERIAKQDVELQSRKRAADEQLKHEITTEIPQGDPLQEWMDRKK